MKKSLTQSEKSLIVALLQGHKNEARYVQSLDDLTVLHMNDGGMGSLRLTSRFSSVTSRSLGRQIALGEFLDADGIPVSISLNVDCQGHLFELDVWKVDFSPVLTWPTPESVKRIDRGAGE